MLVICISTSMSPITQKAVIHVDTPLLNWDVIINNQYTVYSISLWKNVLHYLLVPEPKARPDWYPAELFQITNEELPTPTYFKFFVDDKRGVNALWGYQEMVKDYNHYVDLMERDEHALEIFFSRKKEYDKQENN